MTKHGIVTLGFILLVSLPVFAQSSMSLGPQIGIYKSRDADNASVMGGAALRLNLSGLGVEGSVNYRSESYDNDHITVKSMPVMVTGLLYVFPVVYGAVGAGWYNSSIDYSYPPGYKGGLGYTSSETRQQFGWHFGGGADLPLGTSARLVGDIRYVFLDYNFTAIPGVGGLNSNFYVVTAGLQFNL